MVSSVCLEVRGVPEESACVLERLFGKWRDEGKLAAGREFTLCLELSEAASQAGYTIYVTPWGYRVTAAALSNLFAAMGAFFRATPRKNGSIVPSMAEGEVLPSKPIRGIYLATHFHNFYHSAPLDEVVAYVEELGLYGFNMLSAWYDLHHFPDTKCAESQSMIARLKAIFAAAQRVGMEISMTTLANETFADSPPDLRADWRGGQNGYVHDLVGHYHVELCPSKPGGMEAILAARRAMLEEFRDCQLALIWIWPYDQGGCTCADCAPWGANGYLKTARAVAELVRSYFPKASIALSTWGFEFFIPGERQAFLEALEREPFPGDYVFVEPRGDASVPNPKRGDYGGLPNLGFPEISMEFCTPWGGFGASPMARHLLEDWEKQRPGSDGGFLYSEGIFEDINKYVFGRYDWEDDITAEQALKDYAVTFFPGLEPKAFAKLALSLETTLLRYRHNPPQQSDLPSSAQETYDSPEEHANDLLSDPNNYDLPGTSYVIAHPDLIEEIAREALELSGCLSQEVRESKRFQMMALRCTIDQSLQRTQWVPQEACHRLFRQLQDLYYAHHADWTVRPPVYENKKQNQK